MTLHRQSVSMAGINGERAEAIRSVLSNTSERLNAGEILDGLRSNGYEQLLPRYGHIETMQAVLRTMERAGEVDRIKGHRSLTHYWGLA